MNIQFIDTLKLNPYKNNPRKNDQAVDKVAESIKAFGFRVPITVDKNYCVITGHTRLKSAIKLGMTEVPVIVLDDMTEDQIKAFRIADNKVSEYSEWDLDALAIELQEIEMDMSIFDFEVPGATEELVEDDFDINLPSVPKSRYGDVYSLGKHRLMCGDATKVEDVNQLMQDDVADMILTDPPYNVDYESKAGKLLNDNQESAQFETFLTEAFTNANMYLKKGGAFYIWHADGESGHEFRQACRKVGWKIRQCLIWNKNSLVLGRQDYQWKHEPCLYGWKDGASHFFIDDRSFTTVYEDKIDINKLKLNEAKDLIKKLLEPKTPTTVINEDKPSKSIEHPTMKSIRLIGRLIANSSKPEQLILDTFGGSGSTLIASEQLNRKCFMMELDPRYVDVIIDRYEALTGIQAVKIKGENHEIV